MKKKVIALVLALVLLVTPVLTGCGGQGEARGISLVVILGYHANACRPTQAMLESSGLVTLIENAIDYYKDSSGYCHAEANIKFILCDGKPEVIELKMDGEPINMHYEAGNFSVLQEDMRYLAQDIIAALQSPELKADDEESDLLYALSMAGDLLREDPGTQNHIMVIDNGLTTSGFLKMQDATILANLQSIGMAGTAANAEADAVAKAAEDFVDHMAPGSIAKLDGTYLTFHGLGNVDGVTQKAITDQLVKDSLINFWTAYFKRCSTQLVTELVFTVNQNGTAMVHDSDGNGYPYVSNIPFKLSQGSHQKDDDDEPGTTQGPVDEETLVFNENTLTFKSNEALFRNRETAVTEIKNRQDYFNRILKEHPDAIFYVVGSIAMAEPGRTAENGTLSKDRANAVAKIMVEECGISPSQIRIIPAGLTRLSWRNAVEYPNGQETADTPANKQRNRVVAIVPSVFPEPMAELKGENEAKVDLLSWAVPYGG